jgi:hypothetical protein
MTITRRQTLIGAAATVAAAALPAQAEAAAEPITYATDPIIRSTDEGWEDHPLTVSVIVESPFPVPAKLVCPVWPDHDTTFLGIQIFDARVPEQMNREQLADLYRTVRSNEFATDPIGAMEQYRSRRERSFEGWNNIKNLKTRVIKVSRR